ncbi:heparinase II/III family protein [Streptomyces rubiginosohelvolus]|uniref:heparinase II/III domain-containing protein n=1 Tax=Streptomyces rubiginosohelvolus TaxID=67362 RepID=UPI0036D99769
MCDRDPVAAEMVEVLLARAHRWVAQATVCDPAEPVGWWHVCWERLGDVAFAQAWAPDAGHAAWLRAEVLRICALDADDWIGPFFRPRADPLIGTIETGHIGLGVVEVLELCPDLFDQAEHETIRQALMVKGLVPTRRWLDQYDERGDELNNHYLVHLSGYVAMALAAGSEEDVATLPNRLAVAASVFQEDSYAESVQYWGYAALHHSTTYELLAATSLVDEKWLQVAATAVPWVAHSVMFPQEHSPWGPGRHVSLLNFGDSALTGRPPADALLSFARHLGHLDPSTAGLARWLFELTYADVEVGPTDLSSFGFFNQIGWRSVNHLVAAREALSPEAAGVPLSASFSFGTTVERDSWDQPQTVLAVRNGHDVLTTPSHRHRDEASFILGHRGEVLFSDPGHCCYRLAAYQEAKESTAHSTWTLAGTDGAQITQRHPLGDAALGRRYAPRQVDLGTALPWRAYGADVAEAYGAPVHRAVRTWFTCLPHLVIILDEIETHEPVTVDTRFVLNNREDRLETERTADRLVLRRGAAAATLVQADSLTDGEDSKGALRTSWTALHDVYDPLPLAAGQGKEGSGEVIRFVTSTSGQRHRAVYALVLDRSDRIEDWDVKVLDGAAVALVRPSGEREVVAVDQLVSAARGGR